MLHKYIFKLVFQGSDKASFLYNVEYVKRITHGIPQTLFTELGTDDMAIIIPKKI